MERQINVVNRARWRLLGAAEVKNIAVENVMQVQLARLVPENIRPFHLLLGFHDEMIFPRPPGSMVRRNVAYLP